MFKLVSSDTCNCCLARNLLLKNIHIGPLLNIDSKENIRWCSNSSLVTLVATKVLKPLCSNSSRIGQKVTVSGVSGRCLVHIRGKFFGTLQNSCIQEMEMRIGCQNSRRTEDCFWEEDFEGKTKRKQTNLLLSRVHIGPFTSTLGWCLIICWLLYYYSLKYFLSWILEGLVLGRNV